jgi:biopolymer transport protein ExbB
MEFILNGELILWVLGLLSLIATTIILERLMYFRKIKVDEETMISRLKATLEKGHYDEALSICEANPSPVTNLMKVGIDHRDLPLDMIKNMVTDAANMEIPKMERYLSSLGTISSIAPLLGLLGTVLGNISSFGVLDAAGPQGRSCGPGRGDCRGADHHCRWYCRLHTGHHFLQLPGEQGESHHYPAGKQGQ